MSNIDTEGISSLLLASPLRETSTDTVSFVEDDQKQVESLLWKQHNSFEDLQEKREDLLYSRRKTLPNMWSKEYIGLYSQYAAVGKRKRTCLSSFRLFFVPFIP
jgi:hypothetical protein